MAGHVGASIIRNLDDFGPRMLIYGGYKSHFDNAVQHEKHREA
jgi:hypothetical protein